MTRFYSRCRVARTIARNVVAALIVLASLNNPRALAAAAAGSLKGTVVDPLGARVAAAAVHLLRDGQRIADAATDAAGEFAFQGLAEGRYQLEVTAAGFDTTTTDPLFVSASARVATDVRLHIGPLAEQVLVTAAASAVPASQVGASVAVVDEAMLNALGDTDLLEPLRTVPGVQVVQTGARGGATSLFVRGGASNFSKVLLDGVPANDIGGAFDFGNLATTGVDRVEVLRGSNSVLYGSDALAGVINISTRRGRTRIPEGVFSLDGGNFKTGHADVSVGGAVKRFDYFADYSHLGTDNSVPNNAYTNNTFASRFGVVAGTHSTISGTIRRIDSTYGSPNAFDFFGIADDSSQKKGTTFASITAQSQLASKWQSTIRAGVTDQVYHSVNPPPTGVRSDPSAFANFLGNTVTITSGTGASVTGRGILDFGGTYPSLFDSTVTRRSFYAETDYQVAAALGVAGGVRVENESGTSTFSASTTKTDRNNYGAFAEARGSAGGWLYLTGGVSVDHNAIFGNATSPRVSVAAYLRKPSPKDPVGETKLTFNAGKAIKEPNLGQELSSLFGLIPAATAATLGVTPIAPERSRGLDVGLEQGLAAGRARIRVTYFDNAFEDLIEFVSKNTLPLVGVPVAVAGATPFGAYVNSQANRAKGVETSGEAKLGPVRLTASYMYLDAVVTASFSGGALAPATNPKFPGVPIGAFSPLIGARPFRRPTNSGSLTATYSAGRAMVSVAGYFYGAQDDSTFLSDEFFGNSLLLPNKDMDPAYQKFDVNGSYQLHPRLRWFLNLENAFDQRFEAASGFPALPRAVRTGVTVTLGGDRMP